MDLDEMKNKLEDAFVTAGLKFEKNVPLGELMLNSEDNVKLQFIKDAALYFDDIKLDFNIDEFKEEFTSQALDKLVLYFSLKYSKEDEN